MSLSPSVISTPIRVSSSRRFNAIIPLARWFLYAVNAVFLTVPEAVAIIMNLSSSYSRTGKIAVIRSPSSSGKILTIGRPRAVLLASGNWNTFNQ